MDPVEYYQGAMEDYHNDMGNTLLIGTTPSKWDPGTVPMRQNNSLLAWYLIIGKGHLFWYQGPNNFQTLTLKTKLIGHGYVNMEKKLIHGRSALKLQMYPKRDLIKNANGSTNR